MPMPTPHGRESHADFMDRCMSNNTMMQDFPGQAQRAAVCQSQWDEAKKMQRAYSLLTVRSVNEDNRTITGIATTPTPDRLGDVVEPDGAEFKLPIPLLWQHDSRQPIGQVVAARVAKDGIHVTAQIAREPEAGRLKDRLDEAWQSIKGGLVRGLSIGFKETEFEWIQNGKGMRFIKWLWLELSAVTIPANGEASIQTIRSIDSAQRARAAANWSVGASRDLPISASDAWDGPGAAGRMLDAAGIGGDNPRPATAKRGFLIYDSANGDLRGSYKLPFADLRDGRLTAVAGGLRAAASRLPQTDAPQSVRDSARSVLDGYFAKLNQDSQGGGASSPGRSVSGISKRKDMMMSEMPSPASDENKGDFMTRCVSYMLNCNEDMTKTESTQHCDVIWQNSITSTGASELAASGREHGNVKTKAGASAIRKPTKAKEARMKKTIAEQISAFEATRAAKSARMDEIMDDAAENGATLDLTAKDEYDTLDSEVKEIDEHLVRLHAREKTQKAAAVPAAGESIEAASRSRGGDAGQVRVIGTNVPKAIPFIRLVLANLRGVLTHASPVDIAAANKQWSSETPEVEMCLRAAVAAGTTTGTTWAAPLVQYQVLATAFAELLRPLTILGRIAGLRSVPFKVKIPRQTGGATVGWVGENKSKPVSALAFDSVTLDHFKVAGIVALSRELVMLSTPSAEALVRDDLARAIAQYVDDSLTDPDRAEVAAVSPASLTNGVTPVTATGTAYANFAADWRSLMALFLAANITPDTVIMSQTQALAFSLIETSLGVRRFPDLTITGGNFLGLNAIASENIQWTEDSPQEGFPIIALRADEIMLADEGGVSIDVSTEASVQMDGAPTDPITASQVLVSFWQQNLVGIRAERMINWKKRRDAAVQFISFGKYVT